MQSATALVAYFIPSSIGVLQAKAFEQKNRSAKCRSGRYSDALSFLPDKQTETNKQNNESNTLFSLTILQVVLGPPGSGKSTYCQGMQQFLGGLERRPILVNLDPANERPGYNADLSIEELVTVSRVMEEQDLGPNGGIAFSQQCYNAPYAS